MKKLLLSLISLICLLVGCSNKSILVNDKIVKENVIEIDYVNNNQHLQVELDDETQERFINAFNNLEKQPYTLEDVGQFGWMNHFEIESRDEEIKIVYQPLEGAIEVNGQKYIIPMDSEFFELIYELEYLHSMRNYKIYTYNEWIDDKHLIKLPIENYAIVSTQMQIDDILSQLEIETDKQYNMTVQDYIDTKFEEILMNSDEEFSSTGRYILNSVYELDNIEFKVIEIVDGELGGVLFKYKK